MTPIVDSHQHLWDLSRFRLSWTDDVPDLSRSFVIDDYLEATKDLGIAQSVYVEVDVEPSQQAAEVDSVLELCDSDDNPISGMVIRGQPDSPEFKSHVNRFKERPGVKGVRQILNGKGMSRGHCLQKDFVDGLRFLGESGLLFDICAHPEELSNVAKLIDMCKGTSFVLDHCGNPDLQRTDLEMWKRDIAEIARRDRVVCKVSGIVNKAKKGSWTPEDLTPVVDHVYEVFGPDRVMFGSDWPVCTLTATYKQWLDALQAIVRDRSEKEQRQLFHDNARRVYKLN